MGKINVVCKGFIIIETYDAYIFILEFLFQISTARHKKHVYAIFAAKFMTQKILDSIGMHSTRIFYDHFHFKINLKKLFICKCNVLYPNINSMFIAKNEKYLNNFIEKSKIVCEHLNNYVTVLVIFVGKRIIGHHILLIVK